MQKKKQMLTDLEIDKVAFVPVGDNKGADISLYKARPTPDSAEGAPPESAPTKEGERRYTLKGFLEMIAKSLGFKVEETSNPVEKASGNPDDYTAAGGGTTPPTRTAEGDTTPNPSGAEAAKSTKGVDDEVKIDKSKFTPEELKTYEDLVAKAAVQDNPTPQATTNPVEKAATETPAQTEAPGAEDAYKGLNPVVAAELADLRKRADAAEMRELTEVAKKYEVLGKKPEELAATLKTLKAAGGTAYDDMIAVLDSSLDAVEKSGAFSEVGKSGRSGATNDPWKQIEKHAADIQKAAPTMTLAQAIEKACEQHPDLVAEYEKSR